MGDDGGDRRPGHDVRVARVLLRVSLAGRAGGLAAGRGPGAPPGIGRRWRRLRGWAAAGSSCRRAGASPPARRADFDAARARPGADACSRSALDSVSQWRAGLAPDRHAYEATVATFIGVQAVTAAAVLIMALYTLARSWRGLLDRTRRVTLDNTMLLWHYTVRRASWLSASSTSSRGFSGEPTGRESLDGAFLRADLGAPSDSRGTRPDAESCTPSGRNERREAAAASGALNDTPRSVHTRKHGAAQTGTARMTAVDGLGRVGERAAGTVCSTDAITGAGIGRYRKSRFSRFYAREVLLKLEGARRGKEAA